MSEPAKYPSMAFRSLAWLVAVGWGVPAMAAEADAAREEMQKALNGQVMSAPFNAGIKQAREEEQSPIRPVRIAAGPRLNGVEEHAANADSDWTLWLVEVEHTRQLQQFATFCQNSVKLRSTAARLRPIRNPTAIRPISAPVLATVKIFCTLAPVRMPRVLTSVRRTITAMPASCCELTFGTM